MVLISKIGLVIINIFVVLLGMAVVGTAAAVVYLHEAFDVVLPNASFVVPLTILVTGVFIAVLGFFGCIAAVKESKYMLMAYAVVVGVLLLAVTAAGIMLVIFSADATGFLTDSMTDVYQHYGEEGREDLTKALDKLLHEGKCCGIDDYEDWLDFDYRNGTSVPDGCCRKWTEGCGVNMLLNPNVEMLVWSDGCLDYVYYAFAVVCIALAVLSIILVAFQGLSIACACCLATKPRKFNKVLIYESSTYTTPLAILTPATSLQPIPSTSAASTTSHHRTGSVEKASAKEKEAHARP